MIGTGATGVQVVQELGPRASHLTVFQRTPNLSLPMFQAPLDRALQREQFENGETNAYLDKRLETPNGFPYEAERKVTMDDTPEQRKAYFEKVWAQGGFHFWVAGYSDMFFNKEANRAAYDFWAEKTRARISDPKKRDILAPLQPPHAFGTKRPSLEMRYYEVCDQPNVELVDIRSSPIDHVSPSSIITSDGKEHGPFDIIVLATGYDIILGSILNIEIKGKEGITLKEKWQGGTKTYLGLTCSGFPNFFMVYAAQAPTAFVNGPPLLSYQTKWVADCIAHLQEKGKERIEPLKEAEEKWSELSISSVNKSLFAETDSWYLSANIPGRKREPLCYVGGLNKYVGICRDVATKGYEGFVLE